MGVLHGSQRPTQMTDSDFDFDFDVERGRRSPGAAAAGPNGSGRSKRNGDRAATPHSPATEPPPLVYEDGELDDRAAASDEAGDGLPFEPPEPDPSPTPARALLRRFRRSDDATAERPDPPAADPDDDWLSLGDDLGAADLDSLTDSEQGPAGPPTPGEGRELARRASRRAGGRAVARAAGNSMAGRSMPGAEHGTDAGGADQIGADFEQLLEEQPQKSTAARRGSAVIYGLRGLLDDGRERLRGGRQRVGALKERIPDSFPRPSSAAGGNGAPPPPPKLPKRLSSRRPRKPKPGRVKKLRIAIILVGLGSLAMASTVFGMMMAVSSDLPNLESKEQYSKAKNSEVYDSQGRKLGTLLSNSRRILVESENISPYVKQAVVAIEDERFYEHRGVDFQGISRAVVQDLIPGGSIQGASTITQQFVKNALEAQGSRTVFQKLRESALAYHLERQWDKDKVLTQYLNTIYFGEGAYGIEAAARTYFGKNHPECLGQGAEPCASVLTAAEAAMLAGIITSPSAFSPRANPVDAAERRNVVLRKMVEQDVLSEEEYQSAAQTALPGSSDIQRPAEDSEAPYFTSWLRQQLVDKYGAGRAFGAGLDVHTTLDLDMQQAAESAAYNTLAGVQPTASVVVIDNKTGGVKALVGGNDFEQEPFNLATNGLRQPGSAFKPFTLITAFQNGFSPGSTFASEKRVFTVPNSAGKEIFEVNNYDDVYYGVSDLTTATLHSDNSIFAELGFGDQGLGRKGPKKVAQTAHAMGIQTDFSDNPAMILGGLDPGVSPLEMTYAYSTISHDGQKISGSLDTIPGNKTADEQDSRGRRDGPRREQAQGVAGDPRKRGRRHQGHPETERALRDRQTSPDRRLRLGQDRHHGEQR
jgi:membrane peptidoglycan carboxypeptidase